MICQNFSSFIGNSFLEHNAALTGEVMLAALLRFFAAKVTILLNPFERLVMHLLILPL
jgi:hypothetical protein